MFTCVVIHLAFKRYIIQNSNAVHINAEIEDKSLSRVLW